MRPTKGYLQSRAKKNPEKTRINRLQTLVLIHIKVQFKGIEIALTCRKLRERERERERERIKPKTGYIHLERRLRSDLIPFAHASLYSVVVCCHH